MAAPIILPKLLGFLEVAAESTTSPREPESGGNRQARALRRAALLWVCFALACAARQDGDAEARAQLRTLTDRQTDLERRIEQVEARQAAAASLAQVRAEARGEPAARAAEPGASAWVPANLARVRLVPDAPPAPPLSTRTALREPRTDQIDQLLSGPDEEAAKPALDGAEAELEQGLDLIRNGVVERGAAALKDFVDKHPRHDKAALALYTAGVGMQAWGESAQALPLLGRVADEYPDSPEAPAAMLRMAECNLRLKRAEQAREVLGQVAKRYPETPAARSAQLKLAELGPVGAAAGAR